jgi:hypothetical protein
MPHRYWTVARLLKKAVQRGRSELSLYKGWLG